MFLSITLTAGATAAIMLFGILSYTAGLLIVRDRLTPVERLSNLAIEDNVATPSKFSWLYPSFNNEFDDNKFTYGAIISALGLLLIGKIIIGKLAEIGFVEAQQYLAFAGLILFFASMIMLYVIDIETLTMPKNVIYWTTLISGGLLIAGALVGGDYISIGYMFTGGVVTFLFYFLIWFWKPQGLGFSDVRLSFTMGLVLGWLSVQTFIVAALVPFLLATIAIVIMLPFRKKDMKRKFAFGPWMIIGSVFALAWGDLIINYILK